MKLHMILKDGTQVGLVEAGLSRHFIVNCESRMNFLEIWDKMDDENLTEVKITEDDVVTMIWTGLQLVGTQTMRNENGGITGHFYCEGGSYHTVDHEDSAAADTVSTEDVSEDVLPS